MAADGEVDEAMNSVMESFKTMIGSTKYINASKFRTYTRAIELNFYSFGTNNAHTKRSQAMFRLPLRYASKQVTSSSSTYVTVSYLARKRLNQDPFG